MYETFPSTMNLDWLYVQIHCIRKCHMHLKSLIFWDEGSTTEVMEFPESIYIWNSMVLGLQGIKHTNSLKFLKIFKL